MIDPALEALGDGFETTLQIRQLTENKKDIPIIALTADTMKEDKDFVSKPFRLKEIEAVLQRHLGEIKTIKNQPHGIVAPLYLSGNRKIN